jgi:tetratricopeptide (TPR) repeat protein
MPGYQHTQVPALQRVSARILQAALLAALSGLPAQAQGGLEFARQLYNQGRYDQAITAAARLRSTPVADAAYLVLGRSYLERFRKSTDHADLVAAREALNQIRTAQLASRDRIDYLVGLGESLYLGESYGPAAELFQGALERSQDMGPRAFERVFDWWATSLDRQAQSGEAEDRDAVYIMVRDRARVELGRMPCSAAAAYWLVSAYRSLGELTKAWDAAVAGWVRAPLGEDQGRALRADLDQLVLQAIIPERVRVMASSDRDRDRAATSMRAEWDGIKKDWATKRP